MAEEDVGCLSKWSISHLTYVFPLSPSSSLWLFLRLSLLSSSLSPHTPILSLSALAFPSFAFFQLNSILVGLSSHLPRLYFSRFWGFNAKCHSSHAVNKSGIWEERGEKWGLILFLFLFLPITILGGILQKQIEGMKNLAWFTLRWDWVLLPLQHRSRSLQVAFLEIQSICLEFHTLRWHNTCFCICRNNSVAILWHLSSQ